MSSPGAAVYAYTVSAIVLGLVLAPALRAPTYDSFPTSSYPMFARDRAREATVAHVVAISDDGRHRPIPPPLVANDEVLQAAATIHAALRRKKAMKLCLDVAERVAVHPDWVEFTWLEVPRDRYDVITYFEGETKPKDRDIRARCRIKR